MAFLTGADVISSFKSAVEEHYGEQMQNTEALKATAVEGADYVRDRLAAIRSAFNNPSAHTAANTGGLFKGLFRDLATKSTEAEDDGGTEFVSSGTKDDNTDVPSDPVPKLSAGTISRNKTSYEVAGIQVKALVAQTTALVSAMSDQTTVMKNMDSNLQKILEVMNKGFKSLSEENVEQAKDNKFWNEKGYINVANYMEAVKSETKAVMAQVKQWTDMLSDPKLLMKSGFGLLIEKLGGDKLLGGIDEAIARGFTRVVDKISDSPLLKANNAISKTLRRILNPQDGTEMDREIGMANGIDKVKQAQFDNITHRTINDVMPGLLERILAQTEITAKILAQSQGVRDADKLASGTTYDMTTGKFSTAKDIVKGIRKTYIDNKKNVQIKDTEGAIPLKEYETVIDYIVTAMLTANPIIDIKNFHQMGYDDMHNLLLWGSPSQRIHDNIEAQFRKFWKAFHSNQHGQTMSPQQRRAMDQITAYYNDMKKMFDSTNKEVSGKLKGGILKFSQIMGLQGMGGGEILRGKFTNYDKTAKRGDFAPGNNMARGGSDSTFGEIGTDLIKDIGNQFSSFGGDLRKLVQFGVEKKGSLYVHDSVGNEYLKGLYLALSKNKRRNDQEIDRAWAAHKAAHPEDDASSKSAQAVEKVVSAGKKAINAATGKPNVNTDYQKDDEPQGAPGTTGIGIVDEQIENLKHRGMKLAQGAGYKGFDKVLASDRFKDQNEKDKSKVGWAEKSMHNSDFQRVADDIETAVANGKISREKGDELMKELNNSSPEEYKTSLLKTLAQWSPVVLGGLMFGPFGALAGLGIRNIIKRNTSDRVGKALKKDIKGNKREKKAEAKEAKERAEAADALQDALESGKISYEEYEEGMKELSTSNAGEYKGGLMKWAKKLGPAVLGGMAFGPLGFLAGAIIGNKLATPTAKKIQRRMAKKTASSDVWNDEKRRDLLRQIDEKIEELEKDQDQAERANDNKTFWECEDKLVQLRTHREALKKAGGKKLLWYFTSIPGILSAIGQIAKLPMLAVKGVKKLAMVAGKKIHEGLSKAKNAIGRGIKNIFTRLFIGDPRLATNEGRAEMYNNIEDAYEAGSIDKEQRAKALAQLDEQIENFDKKRNSPLMKVLGGIGKVAKGTVGFVGGAAGMLTGTTQKRWAAKANQSAVEAKKILAGKETAQDEIQAVVASNTDQLVEHTKQIAEKLSGNSVATIAPETDSLLRQILYALNPKADTSAADSIDRKHRKEDGSTLTSAKAETPRGVISDKAEQKKLLHGQEVHDDSDDQAMSEAASIVASLGADDVKHLDDIADTAAAGADKQDNKNKIKNMIKKAGKDKKDAKAKDDADGEAKEESLLSKLFGGLFGGDGGGLPGLPGGGGGLMSKVLPVAGFAIAAATFGKNMIGSFTKDYNKEAETRANVVETDMRNNSIAPTYGAAALTGFADDALNGTSKWTGAARQIGSKVKSAAGKVGDAVMDIGGRAMSGVRSIGSKIAGSSIGQKVGGAINKFKTSKVGGIIDDLFQKLGKFITGLKNNAFLGKIGGFFSKTFGKNGAGGKIKEFLLKLFKGGAKGLKLLAKGMAAFGFIAEVVAAVVRTLEDRGTNFSEEMEQAINGAPDVVSQIIAAFECVQNNFMEAAELGGDGWGETILKAIASAGINTALATAFPVYALIKLGLVVVSFILDSLTAETRDGSSISYFILKSFKYLVDDLLALDESVIDQAASVLVDLIETVFSLFSGSLSKIIEKLKGLVQSIVELVTGIGKHLIMILCDLVLLALVSVPVLNVATLAFIKLGGGANALLGIRMRIEQLFNGEISFGDFCSEILASLGEALKNALGKIGEFFKDVGTTVANAAVAAKDAVVGAAQSAGNWIADKWNGLWGKGRKGKGGGAFTNNDLYQENGMYQNSPYNMYRAGCGPIALTSALRSAGVAASPTDMARRMSGYRDADGGTDPRGIAAIGNQMGGNFQPGSTSARDIANAARSGRSVVMMGQNGAFGDGMHYMTAHGMSGNNMIVRDPLNPNMRHIPLSQINGRVTSATYGQGRGGVGGRGFADMLAEAQDWMKKNFGGIADALGISLGGTDSEAASPGNSDSYNQAAEGEGNAQSGSSGGSYIDATPRQAEGDCVSVNGKIVYPKEMCVDPGGNFPRQKDVKYAGILSTVKPLLIAQYKYNLILPSVIACIMRGETSFGEFAHEKNLGNIMDHEKGSGTKAASNMITDAQLGHRYNYEAYNYWGESIYRIGHFLSHSNRYQVAVKNTDTLSSLRGIAAGGYAEAPDWGNRLYEYWSTSDMNTLKSFDKEAIDSVQKDTVQNMPSDGTTPTPTPMPYNPLPQSAGAAVAMGRGGAIVNKNGKGFADMMSKAQDWMTDKFGGIASALGISLGKSDVEEGGVDNGEAGMEADGSGSSAGNSSGPTSSGPNAASVPKEGSYGKKLAELLKAANPAVGPNFGYARTDSPYSPSNPHKGIDYNRGSSGVDISGTRIQSPVDGTITKKVASFTGSTFNAGQVTYGNQINVKDPAGYTHIFAHLKHGSITPAAEGTNIKAGDYLGGIGTTGYSTGNHLHYEVKDPNGAVVDPGAVTGKGRSSSFSSNRRLPQSDIGGGLDSSDYTDQLSMIYDALLQIAENTGLVLKLPGMVGSNQTGNGRGGKNSINPLPQVHAKPRPDKLHHKSNGIGQGYQVLARGY